MPKAVSTGTTPAVERHFTQEQIRSIIDAIRMDVQSRASLSRKEPSDFIRETHVTFITSNDHDDDVEIGEASFLFIKGNLARYTYNCELFHVFDCHSQD